MFLGYLIITIGCFYSFLMVIIGTIFAGVGSSWGQVIHYGYIRKFPAEYVGPFSSGTGLSGFIGSFVYMLLNASEVPNYTIFLFMMPVISIYVLNFLRLHKLSEQHDYFHKSDNQDHYVEMQDNVNNDGIQDYHRSSKSMESNSGLNTNTKVDEQQTLFQGFKTDPYNHILCFLLFFFEYVIIVGFLDRLAQLRNAQDSDEFLEKNLFTVTQSLYQLGVVLARSTLFCYKSKATGKTTIVMLILFIVYFYFCLYNPFVDKFIVMILSLILGLFGGWGYVFSYYRVMGNVNASEVNREKLINYHALCADSGALIATGFATILSNTILRID
jgi:hypothetical protein